MARIRFRTDKVTLDAECLDTPTARAVLAALPFEAAAGPGGKRCISRRRSRRRSSPVLATWWRPARSPSGWRGSASRSASAPLPRRTATKSAWRPRSTSGPSLSATSVPLERFEPETRSARNGSTDSPDARLRSVRPPTSTVAARPGEAPASPFGFPFPRPTPSHRPFPGSGPNRSSISGRGRWIDIGAADGS